MPTHIITLPCTARELEDALHRVCDHNGAWDAKIYYGISGQDLDAVPILRIVIEGEKEEGE